jgi:IS605 OrfB family transposase
MTVTQAFRYELDPGTQRRARLSRAAGSTARYAYNWGLDLCQARLKANQPVPHAAERHRLWNAEKPRRSWVYGVSKCGGQEDLRDLDRAFGNFWRGRKEGRRAGFTRFRRKHGRRDLFRLTGRIRVHPHAVTLPRIESVRSKERTDKFGGRILSATVSREASRWYVALTRLHRRIRCRRHDFLHKTTTELTTTKSVIVVEDLSVRGMIRNRHLSRSITDAGWSEFRRMLEDKTQWYGSRLVVAPRLYPSTKTCSVCGHVKNDMPLSERVFRCAMCGAEINRDLNAARNLAALVAGRSPETQNACGAEGAGRENGPVKPAAVKQESLSRKLAAFAVGHKMP